MSNVFDYLLSIFNGKSASLATTGSLPPIVINNITVELPVKNGQVQLTSKMLTTISPLMKQDNAINYANAVNKIRVKYPAVTDGAMPMFVAQTLEESTLFSSLSENLYYSTPQRICEVWPSRFTSIAAATPYIKNPQKLANFVYANRLGNGDEASNDGWIFRGHGAIQITGRSHHEALAKRFNMTLDQLLAYIVTSDGAIDSAFVFWTDNKLQRFTTHDDVKPCTLIINGAYGNLKAREAMFDAADKVL